MEVTAAVSLIEAAPQASVRRNDASKQQCPAGGSWPVGDIVHSVDVVAFETQARAVDSSIRPVIVWLYDRRMPVRVLGSKAGALIECTMPTTGHYRPPTPSALG